MSNVVYCALEVVFALLIVNFLLQNELLAKKCIYLRPLTIDKLQIKRIKDYGNQQHWNQRWSRMERVER